MTFKYVLTIGLMIFAIVDMCLAMYHDVKGNPDKAMRYRVEAILSIVILSFMGVS